MRIKLLKRLRNEARDRVFLIPISGDIDRCVIEEDIFDPVAVWGGEWKQRYHFKEYCEDAYQERRIPDSLRLKNKKYSRQPYAFNEACEMLDKLRREYVIRKAARMRLTWKKSKEKIKTLFLKHVL